MKKTYLDCLNPIFFDEEKANQFDKNLFFETLLISDKVILTNEHFLDCIEHSKDSVSSLLNLLEKDELSIFYDFLPVGFIKHPENNIMIELKMNKDVDIENNFFADKRYKNLERKSRRIIEKKVHSLDFTGFDLNKVCLHICSILNNKNLLANIYKSSKPNHLLPDVIKNEKYKVNVKKIYFTLKQSTLVKDLEIC